LWDLSLVKLGAVHEIIKVFPEVYMVGWEEAFTMSSFHLTNLPRALLMAVARWPALSRIRVGDIGVEAMTVYSALLSVLSFMLGRNRPLTLEPLDEYRECDDEVGIWLEVCNIWEKEVKGLFDDESPCCVQLCH